MEIQTKRDGKTAVVSVRGRLDTVTAEDYRTAVRVLVETGATLVVVDLSELHYISSVGMSALVLTARWLKEKDGRFGVAGLRESVQAVIEMCGIGKLLNIYPSPTEALAALA
jgi:anti-sigma B factor antagonist